MFSSFGRLTRKLSPISSTISVVSYLTVIVALFRVVTNFFSIGRADLFEALVNSYQDVFHGFIDAITLGYILPGWIKDAIVIYTIGASILVRSFRSYEDPSMSLLKYLRREGGAFIALLAMLWPIWIIAIFLLPILLRNGGQLFTLASIAVLAVLYETGVVLMSLLLALALNSMGIL